MIKANKIALILLMVAALLFTACNKNYYSGNGKSSKNCGCPSQKSNGGW
jgi:predicted small secreted protein